MTLGFKISCYLFSHLRRIVIIHSLIFSTLACIAQDDLYTEELLALVEPINVSYFKKHNFKSLQISVYKIESSDTTFQNKSSFYKLIGDSMLGEYLPKQTIRTNSNAKNYYKEDKFGNLNLKSSTDGKEYPSTYQTDEKGKIIVEMNRSKNRYFFYNDKGQLTRVLSDTSNMAPNKPYSLNEYVYTENLLSKKIRAYFNSGEPNPVSSDTLIYSYNERGELTSYLFTKHSSQGFMGGYLIIRHSDRQTFDIIRKVDNKLYRYKFSE